MTAKTKTKSPNKFQAIDRKVVRDSPTHLFSHIYHNLPFANKLIPKASGYKIFQAVVASLSSVTDIPIEEIVSLFVKPDSLDTFSDSKITEYISEHDLDDDEARALLALSQWIGCAHDKFWNIFKKVSDGTIVRRKIPCSSPICPSCHSIKLSRRKKEVAMNSGDCNYASFTFSGTAELSNSIVKSNPGPNQITLSEFKKFVGDVLQEVLLKEFGSIHDIKITAHTYSSTDLEWFVHLHIFISMIGKKVEYVKTLNDNGHSVEKRVDDGWIDIQPDFETNKNTKWLLWDLINSFRRIVTEKIVSRLDDVEYPFIGQNNSQHTYFYFHQNEQYECFNCGSRNGYKDEVDEIWRCCECDSSDRGLVGIYRPLIDPTPNDDDSYALLTDGLRYLNRFPIANDNILDVTRDSVIFTTQKRKRLNKLPISLTHDKFFHLMMSHLPPKNSRRLNNYGLSASASAYHVDFLTDHGYDFDDDFRMNRSELKEICKIIIDYVDNQGCDIDRSPTYSKNPDSISEKQYINRFGLMTIEILQRVDDAGIPTPSQEHMLSGIINLINSIADHPIIHQSIRNMNPNICDDDERWYFSSGDYSAIFNTENLPSHVDEHWNKYKQLCTYLHNTPINTDYSSQKDFVVNYLNNLIDKLILRLSNGLSTHVEDEDGEFMLWYSTEHYNYPVRQSICASYIFDRHNRQSGGPSSRYNDINFLELGLWELIAFSSFKSQAKIKMQNGDLNDYG